MVHIHTWFLMALQSSDIAAPGGSYLHTYVGIHCVEGVCTLEREVRGSKLVFLVLHA